MQGFNRYYPATYDPADKAHKGNLNRLAGKPAQSNVVRFEMPFNVWCSHCSKLISQGNRFNASKRQAGRYLSTPIWHFTLKCHHCTGFIEIQTNPKETSYDVLSGGVRKAEEWDAKANGALVTETLYRSDDDAVTQLEAESIRRQTRAETSAHLSQLAAANKRWTDEYRASQVLRKRFRDEKKQRQLTSKKCKEVERRFGLAVDVL
ncbi:CWC16 protein, partial [Protomyces lactucae-debilis]